MLFSVITVCLNSAKTIRQTIESVFNQTCTDYEYIIIDGGSTDGTLDIIKEYEPKFNGRMRWTSEPDNGIYDAMNKGIRIASGEFLNMMNADDCFDNDYVLAKVASAISADTYKAVVYLGITRSMKNGHEYLLNRWSPDNLPERMFNHQACFISRKAHEIYGNYDINYKIAADYKFMLSIYCQKEYICPIDIIVAKYNVGGISVNRSLDTFLESQTIRCGFGFIDKHKLTCIRIDAFFHKMMTIFMQPLRCMAKFIIRIVS